jgi:hypothetical protein
MSYYSVQFSHVQRTSPHLKSKKQAARFLLHLDFGTCPY